MNRGASGRLRGRGLLLCAGLALAALAGCEARERDNLFDPHNPDTGGRPQVLAAVAGYGEVQLVWTLDGFERVDEVELRRSLRGEEERTIFRQAPGGSGRFLDPLIQNELEGIYRLALRAPDGAWLYSEPDTARTGVAAPWLGDAGGGGLSRLSPDGRDRVFRFDGAYEVLDVAPAEGGSVWAADYGFGVIWWIGADQSVRESWDCYGANTIALDRETDLIWVGSFLQQRVFLFDPIGSQVWVDSTAGLVEQIRAAPHGGAWYCVRGGEVRRVLPDRTVRSWGGFTQPTGLAIDEAGDAWITDRGADRVVRISASSGESAVSAAAFVDPVEIEGDGEGGAWVSDPGRGGVVHLDPSMQEDAFLAVPGAWALAWDADHERLWMTRPEVGRVEVWRLTRVPGPGWSGVRSSVLVVGGRPNVVRADWRL